MDKYPRRIFVRMSDDGLAHARAVADSANLTLSQLVRLLLDGATVEGDVPPALVVVDRATAAKLSREMRRWGHHYNQAVHALNSITYYLRANDMDAPDVLEELGRASAKLEAMQPGIAQLRAEAERISHRAIAPLGR